jgi:small subunit ribosomal protein S17
MTEQASNAAPRGIRKTRKGKVVSKSGDKTVVVLVERRYHHPIYGKQMVDAKKMHAHDEKNEAAVGDVVEIQECRPLSRMKRWRLVAVEKAATVAAEGEAK